MSVILGYTLCLRVTFDMGEFLSWYNLGICSLTYGIVCRQHPEGVLLD